MKPRHVFADDIGNIYAITFDGLMLWYKDINRNGTSGWAGGADHLIGTGWQDTRHVFCGGEGIIYAIDPRGDLFWYKDVNRDGTAVWAERSGNKIGNGWQEVRLVFSDGQGVIYAIKDNGDLFYFRDVNRNGTPGWGSGSGNRIGTGWQGIRAAWADTDGSIYAARDDGDLLWFKDAVRNGSPGWASGSGNRIGSGWNGAQRAFSGGSGITYAINNDGDLLWYRDGNRDGTAGWVTNSGNRIGNGWNDARHAPPLAALGHRSFTVNGRPALGSRRLLVVLAQYDNTSQNDFPPFPANPGAAHSPSYYDRAAFGTPTPPFSTSNPANPASLKGYFLENSCGRFLWVRAGQGMVGPVSMGAFSNGGNPGLRAANVLARVSQFNLFRLTDNDFNNDGTVAFDELCVLIIENFDGPSPLQPANRPNNPIQVSEFSLGGTVTKTIAVQVAFVGPRTPFYQIAHETSHSLGLGAASDLRGYGEQNNLLTIMSGYSFNSDDQRSVHFDAFHKHVLGWTDARVFSLSAPQETIIPVTHEAQPDAPVLLWDPLRGVGDYFLLEFRTPNSHHGLAYDEAVAGSNPGSLQEGLAIWRMPGIPSGSRPTEHLGSTDLRPAGSTLWQPGQTTPELTWSDGTPTGTRIRVGPINRESGTIQVAWWNSLFPLYFYAVQPDGQLAWLRHDGALVGGGLESWREKRIVGNGWQDLAHVFPAGDGVIYAVARNGELRWFRHGGYREGGGLETWEPQDTGHRVVGIGWNGLRHVFWGGDGVVYAVARNGDLLWHKHNGYPNGGGLETWEPQDTGHRVVGRGWGEMLHVFSAGNGIIYAVTPEGELRWFRHRGYLHGGGLETWEPQDSGFKVVGRGWQDVQHIVWGGQGIIYAVAADGTLRWYRHNGYESGGGLSTWEPQDTGHRNVGIGWGEMQHVFSMGTF
jgi:M6 family metalloprotease-like protein